jgi:hypothetical protein
MTTDRSHWKPIFITLLSAAVTALACCWAGGVVRGSLELPLLLLGALASVVFFVQLLVAFIRLVIDFVRK